MPGAPMRKKKMCIFTLTPGSSSGLVSQNASAACMEQVLLQLPPALHPVLLQKALSNSK